jgi:hypothetical protein
MTSHDEIAGADALRATVGRKGHGLIASIARNR